MRYPRFLHKLYANINGYFWLPCPICGEMFGGHEWKSGGIKTYREGVRHAICPVCAELDTSKYIYNHATGMAEVK